MNQMVSITASLDPQTSALVAQAAEQRGITPAEYAADAVRRVAESDAEYRAFIQKGIDDLDRGRTYTQEQVEEWFEARYRHLAAE